MFAVLVNVNWDKIRGWVGGTALVASNNLQDSEKGETDYLYGVLPLNSAYQIWKGMCHQSPQR